MGAVPGSELSLRVLSRTVAAVPGPEPDHVGSGWGDVPGPKPTRLGFLFGWFYVAVLGPEPTQELVGPGPKHRTGVGEQGRGYVVHGSESISLLGCYPWP